MLTRALDGIFGIIENVMNWLDELVGRIFRVILGIGLVALCIAAFFIGREIFRDVIDVTNELQIEGDIKIFMSRITTYLIILFAFMVVASVFIIHLWGRIDNIKEKTDFIYKNFLESEVSNLKKRLQTLEEDLVRQQELEHDLNSRINEAEKRN